MSRRFNKQTINRTELLVLIIRNYKNQKEFCESQNPPINYLTFRTFMAGNNTLTNLNKRLSDIMISYGYDPYGPEQIEPVTKLQPGAIQT